ncbi:hypothetical protein ACFE04_014820 [Oxalis oulophora]
MSGTTTTTTAEISRFLNNNSEQQQFSYSLSTVYNRLRLLAIFLRSSSSSSSSSGSSSSNVNMNEFYDLCLSLARHVDYALANNEVPSMANHLPSLLEEIYVHTQCFVLQPAIMLLMVSIKSACKAGWFSDKERQLLLGIANEIASFYCTPGGLNSTENYSFISDILARFYPLMSMGNILASLEVKRGYGAYLMDFQVSNNIEHSPHSTIRLFVAQTDNIETSVCITSPQQVNFLINGNSIEGRTNVFMDSGPQMPTDVTSLLKCGTNLLQAVGQFDGDYMILIAFMGVNSPPSPMIEDYVQHDVATQDLDSDILEGPSRISLNCPISYTRIKTPVKGHLCKHLQCFDFDNYVDINSRRPSWRCPHCNHPVCYDDIRLDGHMVKVLQEVGDSVEAIIISADGSWNAVFENDNPVNQTLDDNVMDEMIETESEDRKPVIDQSVSNNEVGVYQSAIPPVNNIGRTGNLLSPSVPWDPIYSGHNNGADGINDSLNYSSMQNQLYAAFTQLQHTNQALNHEYATTPHNSVTSSATISAFPVPSCTPSMQLIRRNLCNPVSGGTFATTQAPFTPLSTNPTSSQQHHAPIQRWNQGHQAAGSARSALPPVANRVENQNLHRQQAVVRPSSPVPQIPVQAGRRTTWTPMQQCVQTAGTVNRQYNNYKFAQPMARPLPSASSPGQTSRIELSHPVNAYTVRPPESRGDMGAAPTEKNCVLSAGRMRGSLSGRNYSPSVSPLIIQPTQSTQLTRPVRPPQNLSSTAPITVPSFEALLAETRADNPPQSGQ